MIGNAIWISSIVALGIGLAHALYVYRQEIGEFRAMLVRQPIGIRLRAVYYALWTLVLWLLLGATVVLYWAIALVPYLIAKIIKAARAPHADVGPDVDISS